jgi:hypothetical protein
MARPLDCVSAVKLAQSFKAVLGRHLNVSRAGNTLFSVAFSRDAFGSSQQGAKHMGTLVASVNGLVQ